MDVWPSNPMRGSMHVFGELTPFQQLGSVAQALAY